MCASSCAGRRSVTVGWQRLELHCVRASLQWAIPPTVRHSPASSCCSVSPRKFSKRIVHVPSCFGDGAVVTPKLAGLRRADNFRHRSAPCDNRVSNGRCEAVELCLTPGKLNTYGDEAGLAVSPRVDGHTCSLRCSLPKNSVFSP